MVEVLPLLLSMQSAYIQLTLFACGKTFSFRPISLTIETGMLAGI